MNVEIRKAGYRILLELSEQEALELLITLDDISDSINTDTSRSVRETIRSTLATIGAL